MSGFFITFIQLLFQALSLAILGRVLISWIDPLGNMSISRILHELTEPILGPIRSILPSMGMLDLSPLVAMLILQLISQLIIGALRG